MSATNDRSFRELRSQFDSWILTQDEQALEDYHAALRERSNDSRLYFRGYVQGVASRLGITPPTMQRALATADSRSGRERLADMRAFDDEHPGAFEQWALGYFDGYSPDRVGAGDKGDELIAD